MSCLPFELDSRIRIHLSVHIPSFSHPSMIKTMIAAAEAQRKNKIQTAIFGFGISGHVTVMLSQSKIVERSWNCHNEHRMIYGFYWGEN